MAHIPLTSPPSYVWPHHRFRGLLGDVFPGVPVTDATDPELEAAIRQAAAARKLTLPPEQVWCWRCPVSVTVHACIANKMPPFQEGCN
jgi:hypothetical protein